MYGYMIICRRCGYRKEVRMSAPFTLSNAYCPDCKKKCESMALPESKTYLPNGTDTTIQVKSELEKRIDKIEERITRIELTLRNGVILKGYHDVDKFYKD